MKKILHYTDTPQIGGAELQIFLLSKFLNKEKFEPILACSNYSSLDKWCENFQKENFRIIRMNVKHKHDPRHYFQLRKILREEKINILHLHIWNPASCRYAFGAAKSLKIPVITTEHDPFKLSALKDFFKRKALHEVKKIITVSKNNAKILKEIYPEYRDKIAVIHNGIDITWWQSQLLRFTEEDRREIKEEKFLARENTLIITSIAELHERKGLKYLIEAVGELVAKYPNIKLVIIGEGSERNNLENLIGKLKLENHVVLLGRQKEIPKLLKSSDIFVLPSRREAFGLVNAEAMITGLPIVASNVGGISEIVEDDESGILVEPENSRELAKALRKLISSESLRENMAKVGQKIVAENFSAKVMAEKYEKIYENI